MRCPCDIPVNSFYSTWLLAHVNHVFDGKEFCFSYMWIQLWSSSFTTFHARVTAWIISKQVHQLSIIPCGKLWGNTTDSVRLSLKKKKKVVGSLEILGFCLWCQSAKQRAHGMIFWAPPHPQHVPHLVKCVRFQQNDSFPVLDITPTRIIMDGHFCKLISVSSERIGGKYPWQQPGLFWDESI